MSAPSEQSAVDAVDRPATVSSLVADLSRLGIGSGDVVIVHSSLRSIGWVAGGAQAVVEALLTAVGPTGTIVMPTQSGQLSDPAQWEDPPVPAAWHDTIRAEMPAFDPHLTPTRSMGAIIDCFRSHSASIRSAHPTVSFAANGHDAQTIIDDHPLAPGLGDGSPLTRLYDLNASVLLIGVGHGNNTSLHLAEHRASWAGKGQRSEGAPVLVDGERRWAQWEDLDIDEGDFDTIGSAFASAGQQQTGLVGMASSHLMSQRALVDFAVSWMSEHR